ncbi:MAG: hypothetical protein AAB598_01945 [Patescibacteria group bacterium]
MGDIRSSILSLLALAQAESLPALSFADICALLPSSAHEVAALLMQLEKDGLIFSRNGWYALAGAPDTDEIKKLGVLSSRKIMRNRAFFFLMQAIPFVEASAITGSVSMRNAGEKSDIDILCVVTQGRLWTSRILLLFLAELFGKRRERGYSMDKLCFNCFVTKNTVFPFQNIASAHMLARAMPLFGSDSLEMFFKHNAWIEEYVSRSSLAPLSTPSRALRSISTATAWLLSGSAGNALERSLAQWQIRRLRNKAKNGTDTSGLVLRDDLVTLYYPDSKNKAVMARYTDIIAKIDF